MKEKTIVEHLEEVRKRIIIYLVSLGVSSIIAFGLTKEFLEFLLQQVGSTVFLSLPEGFLVHLKLAVFIGFFISLPMFFYQVWSFVGSALMEPEEKFIKWFCFFSLFLFVGGAVFAYFVVLPLAIEIFLSYQNPFMQANLEISQYLNFVGGLLIAFGFIFELPLVIIFLTKLHIVGPGLLVQKRKYAILVIFIIAAILTPTQDILTQFLMATPLFILYEVGIILSRFAVGKNKIS